MKQIFRSIFQVFTPLRLAITAAAIVFFWFLLFGDQGIYHLNKLSLMKNRLATQKETLKSDIERLTQDKEMLKEPKNLEGVIRRELGYVRPGEVIYQEKAPESEPTKEE